MTVPDGTDAIADQRESLEAMKAELTAAPAIYHPSAYWEYFNDLHVRTLSHVGLGRFKRTINQNYFNFVPSLADPHLLCLLRWWLRHPRLGALRNEFADPDADAASGRLLPVERRIFRAMVHRPGLRRIGRRAQVALYRLMVSLLWEYTTAHDPMRLLDGLEEPQLGMPIDMKRGGRRISQDLAHSVLEANAIFEGSKRQDRPATVVEVGAGYGRLGYVLVKALGCRYFVFDIAPGLCVSQWYLSQLFPEKRIFPFRRFSRFDDVAEELASAELAFFTPNQIELFPRDYFDVAVNISSLHEMRHDQITNLLGHMYRVTRGRVYLKQYKKAVNPHDHIVVREDAYHIPEGWAPLYHRSDAVDPRFFELAVSRVN